MDRVEEVGYRFNTRIYIDENGYFSLNTCKCCPKKYYIDGHLVTMYPTSDEEMNELVLKEMARIYPHWITHGLTGEMTWISGGITTILLPHNGKLEITLRCEDDHSPVFADFSFTKNPNDIPYDIPAEWVGSWYYKTAYHNVWKTGAKTAIGGGLTKIQYVMKYGMQDSVSIQQNYEAKRAAQTTASIQSKLDGHTCKGFQDFFSDNLNKYSKPTVLYTEEKLHKTRTWRIGFEEFHRRLRQKILIRKNHNKPPKSFIETDAGKWEFTFWSPIGVHSETITAWKNFTPTVGYIHNRSHHIGDIHNKYEDIEWYKQLWVEMTHVEHCSGCFDPLPRTYDHYGDIRGAMCENCKANTVDCYICNTSTFGPMRKYKKGKAHILCHKKTKHKNRAKLLKKLAFSPY